jgi:hypothetical protein
MKILKKGNQIKEFSDNENLGDYFNDWIDISNTEEGKAYLLKKAKDEKLVQLEAFILSKKTTPFTTHKAPEITGVNPYVFGADVQFTWFIDEIPNSNLTPESILNKCTLDTVDCINNAINNSIDFASFKTNYANYIKQKIVPFSTTITKDNKQTAGVVNIFPVVLTLANHIQQREIDNNKFFKIKEYEINNCKNVEEVKAIKFE